MGVGTDRAPPALTPSPQAAANTTYADLERDVAAELAVQVEQALAAGVSPWQIIADPGLGFAKTHEGNCRCAPRLRRPLPPRAEGNRDLGARRPGSAAALTSTVNPRFAPKPGC